MHGSLPRHFVLLTGLAILVGSPTRLAAAVDGPHPVSPGAVDRVTAVAEPCPTFSWSAADGASGHELVIYRVTTEGSLEGPVLEVTLPAGASSWTPAAEQCLGAGRHAWVVRAVDADGTSRWSEPALFAVPETPSRAELEAALATVRRYLEARRVEDVATAASEPETEREAASSSSSLGPVSRPLTAGASAIRGELPDATGTTYGVVGISNSPDGAGVAAENAAGGTDLVLGGASPALLTEAGITRDSGTALTFDIVNPSGDMTLMVDGGAVFTEATDGPGSGLDADLLDGQEATAFAPAAHLHDDRYFTEGELSTSGGGGAVHWDNLASVPADLADGDDDTTYTAGPGLTLEGTRFALASLAETLTPMENGIFTLDNVQFTPDSSVTVGSDGLGLAAYHYPDGGDLRVAHCENLACTSATVTTLDDAGSVGRFPSVTVGSDGLGLVSYYDASINALKVAHCDDVACTSATLETVDSADRVGRSTSIALGSDGLALIAYWDETNDDLKVAHCDDPTCSSATINTLDASGQVGQSTSLAIGADGLGLISYYDQTNRDLKVAHCNDLTCSSAALATIDGADDVGLDTSITIGADGLGLVSYYDASNNALKVAHCDDLTCSSAAVTSLDTSIVGPDTSITIGADGLPLIAYYHWGQGDIRVAHCNDVACGSAAIITVDGQDGNVAGVEPSVTIGVDGLPLIVYWDQTNDALKVAHCANPFCVPHFRRR